MRQDLLTERQNDSSAEIDALPTSEMLRVINAADKEVAFAVERELGSVSRAVDAIVQRLQGGGRLFYIGAGTSGRLGVLDASECPPTFNTPPELVQGIIAGGDGALRRSIEQAEDDPDLAELELRAREFSGRDAVVGIAASGRTPYVLGGLRFAQSVGGLSIGLSCSPGSEVASLSEIAITPAPGAEIVTGSTRLRAGTATKLVLNMLSTGVMIRMGYVYGNLMVNVQPTNGKLADRARRIIASVADVSYEEAAVLLENSGSVRIAILMHKRQLPRAQAEVMLTEAKGSLRNALQRETRVGRCSDTVSI